MTIAISIRVGEGLVYAADSTSTLFETVNGVSVLAQSFHHAQKLMQVSEHPVGVLTYGLGFIGTRNIESLVAEYQSEVMPETIGEQYQVHDIAVGLHGFLVQRYEAVFPAPPSPAPPELPEIQPAAPEPDPRPRLGIVVGGYSQDQFLPDEYVFELPGGAVCPARDEALPFGVLWWGQTDSLQRLLIGFDYAGVASWLSENGVEQNTVPQLLDGLRGRLQWRMSFDGMPLQDAIDLAVFLTNVAIGQSRFVVGPPVCGGHVDVATISHRGFGWIRRKELRVKSDSAFF